MCCFSQPAAGEHKIHPMAFDFPRADTKRVFFPTVHIHDGSVTAKANFDHTLYFQATGNESHSGFKESAQLAKQFMPNIEKARGIVDPGSHVYRKTMNGMLKNEDVIL